MTATFRHRRCGFAFLFCLVIMSVLTAPACEDASGPTLPPIDSHSSEWVLRNPYPTPDRLQAFDWISPVAGVAVGDRGTLLLTEDGGDTWTLTHPCTSRLNAVDFADANVGFAAGEDGTVIRTADGGKSWQALVSGVESDLHDVSALDPNTCTIVGAGGVVLKSDNGGSSWQVQNSGTANDLHSVSFSDVNHGVAVSPTTLIFTNNGGATWEDKSANLPAFLLADVAMLGPASVAAACSWAMIRSGDGGDSWTVQIVEAYVLSMSFADAAAGWAIGVNDTPAPTRLYTTTNGGASWALTLHDNIQPGHISFRDPNHGMLVGGKIHATSNGGRSWERKDKGTRARITDVALLDERVAVSVRSDGVVMRSTNSGREWTEVHNQGSNWLAAVSFADPATGLAAGWNGVVLKTSDSGASWSTLNSGTSGSLYDVHMLDGDNAIAGGVPIVRTSDGGATWEQIDPGLGSMTRYYAVHYLGEQDIFAVGWTPSPPESTLSNQGIIARTGNAGLDWTFDYFPDVQWLRDITFIDNKVGVVVGDGYSVYRTIDGGDTWVASQVGIRGRSLEAVVLETNDTGIAVGGFGVILSTQDGGLTWQPEESNIASSLYGIALSDGGRAVAVGQSGAILTSER